MSHNKVYKELKSINHKPCLGRVMNYLREKHKDRHEKIGEGSIGIEAFKRIINHPKLRNLPFYLETPNELDGYEKEIALLKSLYE